MISIRECCNEVEAIEREHTTFMVSNIEPIIDFYIALFQLMERTSVQSRNDRIIKEVKDIGQLSAGKKKALLVPLFKKKVDIKKIIDYKNIKFDNKLKVERNNLPQIIKELQYLKERLIEVLTLRVYDDAILIVRNKNLFLLLFENIELVLPSIFNYKWFSKLNIQTSWNPYKLTSKLGINVCPYCNRQYTFTVSSSKKQTTRPELDHFLPKAENPIFALSFYNLIPSCTVCNRDLKGKISFDACSNLSPYAENPKHTFFQYNYSPLTYEGSVGLSDEISLKLEINDTSNIKLTKKLQSNLEVFRYDDIAFHHRDVAQEIIRKRHFSEDNYIQILQNTFPNAHLSLEEAYKYAYGNFYDEKDFAKRPLAKLTKDIAINVGSIHTFNEVGE